MVGVLSSTPARADTSSVFASNGDFSITVSASDLGITPAALQEATNTVTTEDIREHVSLAGQLKRNVAEYGGDISGLVDTDLRLDLSPDGSAVTFSIPASEVQTSQTFWQSTITLVVVGMIWLVGRAACVTWLTFSGFGAALVPVICTPVASGFSAFATSLMQHIIDGDVKTPKAWADILVKTLIAASLGFVWEKWVGPFAKTTLPDTLTFIGDHLQAMAQRFQVLWDKAPTVVAGVGESLVALGALVVVAVNEANANPSAPGSLPCDIYGEDTAGAPCTAAYSTTRALFSSYGGPLYQVQRASDNTTADIGLLSVGGYVNAATQDSFCADTSCTISEIYDQSPQQNDLTIEGTGGAASADGPASATALPITVAGHKAYGISFPGHTGYRDDATTGIATNGAAEGMYMVASGTRVNDGCCFDFGNAEANNLDTGNGHMDSVNFSTTCYFAPCTGTGPWVEADLENGLFQGGDGSNTANTGLIGKNYVTAMLKNNGQTTYSLRGGDANSGGLTTWYDGGLPTIGGYKPMQQEGAIVLGTGGDNSNWAVGSFFEGVMTAGYPSDVADAAVQADIVSADYQGDSAGTGGATQGAAPSAAGQAVVHTAGATGKDAAGYSSVYTVDSSDGHLRESYLPAMGDSWSNQDLSAKYGTPAVMPGTQPVSVVHCGFTSVYTVDAANGDLQETYLPAIGGSWTTQDLTAKYGTPPTDTTPTAVVHYAGATGSASACGFTSVYTVDRNGDLQETYLTLISQSWATQDLSANYGTPKVESGTSPVALVHCGYTSVYTVDGDHDLQETFLPAIGGSWSSQDLSAKYGTPKTDTTPTAVMHTAGAGGASPSCGFTSVYSVNERDRHLQETYLPNAGFPGNPWQTQDLSAKYGTPAAAPGTAPVALVHMDFTSVYTVDQGSLHLQETYLPAVGQNWLTQDLSANYGTPPTYQTPIVLVHPDASGNLDWTSVFTVNQFDNDLQETYLTNVGFPGSAWKSQDISANYGTPPVAVPQSSQSGWSVDHDGYTSTFTVNPDHSLEENYLPAMGGAWQTQNLSNYGAQGVEDFTTPVALVHDGFTSVFTVDGSDQHLRETYLPAMGGKWLSQDLSATYQVPSVAAGTSPTVVFHDGYVSVYTVDADKGDAGDLQETFLPAAGFPGDRWQTQDLSKNYGAQQVLPMTSPVALLHGGYVSVYTVDAATNDLRETYLPAMGDAWSTQDLSANYHTPRTHASPTAIAHDGYVSVYTVDMSDGHLWEAYLPAMGDAWSAQDLSANYHTQAVSPDMPPVALYHSGYVSVYTVDAGSHDLRETYLPAMGDAWSTQDLSANYHTPSSSVVPPSPLVHYAANGGLTWTSLFTVDAGSMDLQETYLPAIGDAWSTQDLSTIYHIPPL
ncbi:arabinofuranosidase catalytic domain-containing protein [Kitasatospora sp. NPDC006697]|uniref:arabinofuranosidase catalytic domain-containing protein n=1 Tax=Kitasatospora sp. NPDC006697 TaxID=3364020 RepID=UPI0036980DA7